MLSKFLQAARRCSPLILNKKVRQSTCIPSVIKGGSVRAMSSHMIPPNQYDMPWPKRLQFLYVVTNYWETIPLFTVTGIVLCILFYSICSCCKNKVDVVFSPHNRSNISRTMDLRNPSIHKLIIINQRYDPWPEMQDVLDKMKAAEKRALVRAQTCAVN